MTGIGKALDEIAHLPVYITSINGRSTDLVDRADVFHILAPIPLTQPDWKCPNCGWRRGAPPEDYEHPCTDQSSER